MIAVRHIYFNGRKEEFSAKTKKSIYSFLWEFSPSVIQFIIKLCRLWVLFWGSLSISFESGKSWRILLLANGCFWYYHKMCDNTRSRVRCYWKLSDLIIVPKRVKQDIFLLNSHINFFIKCLEGIDQYAWQRFFYFALCRWCCHLVIDSDWTQESSWGHHCQEKQLIMNGHKTKQKSEFPPNRTKIHKWQP